MNLYTANLYHPHHDDLSCDSFAAANDQEAVRIAVERYPELDCLLGPGNTLLWEREPQLFLKWLADGAPDVDTVVQRLRGLADDLAAQAAAGFRLAAPVDNGLIRLQRPER